MPFQWDWKINVSGAVGTVLALGALGWNAVDWLRGAEPVLFPPQQVLLCRETQPLGHELVRIGAISAYANTAPSGYPATVLREWIILDLGGRRLEQVAQHRVETSWRRIAEGGAPVPMPDCDPPAPGAPVQLVVAHKGVAAPFQVPGRGSVAHESLFYPHPVDCPAGAAACDPAANQMAWPAFLARAGAARRIAVTLGADVAAGGAIARLAAVPCTILLDADAVEVLRRFNFYAFPCRPESGGG